MAPSDQEPCQPSPGPPEEQSLMAHTEAGAGAGAGAGEDLAELKVRQTAGRWDLGPQPAQQHLTAVTFDPCEGYKL